MKLPQQKGFTNAFIQAPRSLHPLLALLYAPGNLHLSDPAHGANTDEISDPAAYRRG